MSIPETNRCKHCLKIYVADHYDFVQNEHLGYFCFRCASKVQKALKGTREEVIIIKVPTNEIVAKDIIDEYCEQFKVVSGRDKVKFDLPHQFYHGYKFYHIISCGGKPQEATLIYVYQKIIYEIRFLVESKEIIEGPYKYVEQNVKTGEVKRDWFYTYNGPNWL